MADGSYLKFRVRHSYSVDDDSMNFQKPNSMIKCRYSTFDIFGETETQKLKIVKHDQLCFFAVETDKTPGKTEQ